MSEWKTIKLKDFVTLKRGYDLPHDKSREGNYPVIASTNIRSYHNEYKVDPPVVTVGRSGSIGKVQIVNKKAWPLNTTLYVKDSKGNNTNFIYYFLQTMGLEQFNSGAGVPTLNRNHIGLLKIKIPDIKKQEKIANVLSTYDKLIENNNRRIEVLEQAAEEIYKEWFVRMRFPGYENTKFVKGIPEGWEVKKIGDIFNVSSSKRVYSSDYVESGIPFYRSKEVIKLSNGEAVSELLHISDNKYEEFKKKFGVPQRNDILITSVGTIGIPLLITDDNPFYFKDGNLTWIQSSSNPVLSYYLYYWLNSDMGYRSLQMYTIGTSQSALTITNLKRLKLLLPNETVLHKFNDIFRDLNMKKDYLNQQNQNLIKQRDLLLPRLMNGSIEVK
ncbi:restriction endonuclease subunit S [Oceanobacillus sp. FSL K6-2867]|uniref:restriction endonuclease subunit S n=1 Tax=Oceanobacillus sp. FSL K6-2867 TaxID=2954748 RepID=UPI0030DC45DA